MVLKEYEAVTYLCIKNIKFDTIEDMFTPKYNWGTNNFII